MPILAEEESPSSLHRGDRKIFGLQDARALRIVDVVIHVGREVGHAHDLPFQRLRALRRRHPHRRAALAFGVMRDAVAHLPCEIQALPVVLEHIDDPQALLVMIEASGDQVVEHALAGVAERRVAQIVAQRDGLGELLVQLQHLGDGSRDLRHLQRVGEAGPVVIARGREEHLRLVLQAPERLAVHDAIAIALKRRAHVVLGLLALAPARFRALGRLRRQDLPLARLEMLTNARHESRSGSSCRASSAPR